MAAHGIPYVATLALGSVPMLRDFRAKVARAAELQGFRFLHVLGACPPGLAIPDGAVDRGARLAVESRYFPLFECDHGAWRITFRPKHPVPVERVPRRPRGASATCPPAQIETIQSHVDERWELLAELAPQS